MDFRLITSPAVSRRSARWLSLALLASAVVFGVGLATGQTPAPSKKAFGDLAKGKALYTATCVPCHGAKAEGKKEFMAPALHRQEAWYLMAQLQKFRSGQRGTNAKDTGGAMMRPMAQSLPDEQALLDVATYVTSLEAPLPPAEVKGDLAAGKTQFTTICAACHGEKAEGKPELKTPALVGQNDWYLVAQLKKFKDGHRGYDPADVTGLQMKGMAATLPTDQAVQNVVAYIATIGK